MLLLLQFWKAYGAMTPQDLQNLYQSIPEKDREQLMHSLGAALHTMNESDCSQIRTVWVGARNAHPLR